jgi:uncharacterized RDD family membrane protein YckC
VADENLYQAPDAQQDLADPSRRAQGGEALSEMNVDVVNRRPAVSPVGTTMPRYLAATLDNVFALLLAAITAKQLPEDWYAIHLIFGVMVFLGYYLLVEILLSATPGKIVMGLKILGYDGCRCSAKQIVIRTPLRILEVNPFLGALPAVARIVLSRDKQRFGDKFADTLVVFRRAIPTS